MTASEKIITPPSLLSAEKIAYESSNLKLMKNFIKRKENFRCEVCGEWVEGDGYTDHCPKCLWGKHADKEVPGDRKSGCGGLMKAEESKYQKSKIKIKYRCLRCGYVFWIREGKKDDREKLMELCSRI